MNIGEALSETFGEVIRFTTTGERLLFCMKDTRDLVERIGELVESDEEIAPELLAAVEHLSDSFDALERASTFTRARMDTRITRIIADMKGAL